MSARSEGRRSPVVEEPSEPNFMQLRRRGLTTRECEILHWVAAGKRDGEIALVLSVAPRTVSKHVEHVLRKLGAENRVGAVNVAREWLRAEK